MNMDNEPRMQDRSPEGQMFAIESEIKKSSHVAAFF